jgi:hypothetical protein
MHMPATITETAASGTLPWVLAALAVGIVLWATGGWVLRSAVGAMGLGLGGLVGMMIWEQTHIGPQWVAPVVGGIVIACVALLAYKLLAGALLAITLAVLGGSVAWTVLHISDDEVPPPPVASLFGLPVEAGIEEAKPLTPVSLPSPFTLQSPAWTNHEKLVPFRDAWETLPPDPRLVVLATAGIAALAGLILSTFFTTAAAVLLTAAAGSGLVLAGLPRLLDTWSMVPDWLGGAAGGSTIVLVWLGATMLGLIVQGMTRPRLTKAPPVAATAH